jgi:uncharacterized membrane protein required for colicin V production
MKGWRRGLFLQLMSLLASLFSFVVASLFYQEFALKMISYLKLSVPSDSYQIISKSVLTGASQAFFASVAFSLLFISANIVARLFLLVVRRYRRLLSFGKIGRGIAGILSLLVTYFSLQLALTLLALLPVSGLQTFLSSSQLAQWIVLHTPISSNALLHLFISNMLHIKLY